MSVPATNMPGLSAPDVSAPAMNVPDVSVPGMIVPRRVVTGHTPDGVSVVLSDGPVPVSRELPDDGVAFHEIWNTEGTPARIVAVEPDEPTARTLAVPPPPHGTKIRINEFLPGHLDERGLQSPVHRTASIDYGIVLEGEITLVLDGSEVVLRAGDVVVQRGTDHAWANRGTVPARVVFVLVDGEFDDGLTATLPGGLAALMHGGPRD
jgi:mannose-6-phosphate isomerase-like protein (cupin superfamily)